MVNDIANMQHEAIMQCIADANTLAKARKLANDIIPKWSPWDRTTVDYMALRELLDLLA